MVKNIFTFYLKNKYASFPTMFFLIFVLGVFEFVGIGVFIPLLDSSENILSTFLASMFKFIDIEYNDLTISTFVFFVFFVKLIVVVLFNNKLSYKMNNFVYEVRSTLIKTLNKVEWVEVQKYEIGELNNLITKESEKLSEGYVYVLDITLKVILTSIYISLSLLTNVYATFFSILLGGIFVVSLKKIVRLSREYSKEVLQANESTNGYIGEILHGLKYLQSTNGFININKKTNDGLYQYSFYKYKLDFFGKLSKVTPESIGVMLIVSVLIINFQYIHNSTISVLLSAVLLYKTFQNITALQYVYQKLAGVSASVNKITSLIHELENKVEKNGNISVDSISELSINQLQFSFQNKCIVEDFTFTFERGNVYALVGESGSGKTTILNILPFLYSVDREVYTINRAYDSNDIDKYSFRSKIGYVTQEPIFFKGSIRENILLNNSVDDEYFNKVINITSLQSLIEEKGADTVIDGFGKELSGGQLQRINIARELIKKPDMLILDEATSALDANIEKDFMEKLLTLKDNMIIVIVAHRLSGLINSDKIICLENGTISNSANFKELYNTDSLFKRMCNNQNIFL